MKKLLTTLAAIVLFAGAAFTQPGSTNPVIPGGGSGGTGTIGGTLGTTDNVAVCTDGTGGVTAQACTDQALFPAGSVSAPGITFVGDSNTGLQSVGDGYMDVVLNGARVARFSPTPDLIMSSHLSGGGYNFTGFMNGIEVKTNGSGSPYSVAQSDSYNVFVNTGATAEVYLNLSSASPGYEHTACVQDSDGLRFVASAGDTIRSAASVTTSGGYVSSTTIGSCITIVSINTTEWMATSITGTWSFN